MDERKRGQEEGFSLKISLTLIAITIVVLAYFMFQRSSSEQAVVESTAVPPVSDQAEKIEEDVQQGEAVEEGVEKPNASTEIINLNALVVGDLAPEFVLTDINGSSLKLADVRGKPIFISFFHSW